MILAFSDNCEQVNQIQNLQFFIIFIIHCFMSDTSGKTGGIVAASTQFIKTVGSKTADVAVKSAVVVGKGVGKAAGSTYSAIKSWGADPSKTEKVADNTVIGVTTAGGIVVASSLSIKALGFKTAGIAAKSIAAGMQAGVGNVAAGSGFATLQSWGATGLLTTTGVVGVAIVGGGLTYWGVKAYLDSRKLKPKL